MKKLIVVFVVCIVLAGCSAPTPTPTVTLTATATPTSTLIPTKTPIPTPTSTSIPTSMEFFIEEDRWSEEFDHALYEAEQAIINDCYLVPNSELIDKSGIFIANDKLFNHPITLKLIEEMSKVTEVGDKRLWVGELGSDYNFQCISYLFISSRFTEHKEKYENKWVWEYWYLNSNLELKVARIVTKKDWD